MTRYKNEIQKILEASICDCGVLGSGEEHSDWCAHILERKFDRLVEVNARDMCLNAGVNPDKRVQEYGQTPHAYKAWELYREAAIKAIMGKD